MLTLRSRSHLLQLVPQSSLPEVPDQRPREVVRNVSAVLPAEGNGAVGDRDQKGGSRSRRGECSVQMVYAKPPFGGAEHVLQLEPVLASSRFRSALSVGPARTVERASRRTQTASLTSIRKHSSRSAIQAVEAGSDHIWDSDRSGTWIVPEDFKLGSPRHGGRS